VKRHHNFSHFPGLSEFRYHHSVWKNGCDTLTAVGLHENWTLALRCRVSGVRCQQSDDGEQKTEDSKGASSSSFNHLSSTRLSRSTLSISTKSSRPKVSSQAVFRPLSFETLTLTSETRHPWPRPNFIWIWKISHYWDLLQWTVWISYIAPGRAETHARRRFHHAR
jgi:hypothetical protein